MLKLDDFKFGKVYGTYEIGHIVGGKTKCETGGTSCTTAGTGDDVDNSQGDQDIKEVKTTP